MAQRTARSGAPANQEGMKSPGRRNREDHIRHRDYSPTLGRFIERDPIGFEAGDGNWYRFVANGPTGKVDPSGLITTLTKCLESPAVLAICIEQCVINKGQVAKELMKQGQSGVVKLLTKWGGTVIKGAGKGSHVKVILGGETFIVAEPVSIGVANQIIKKILSM